MLTLSVISCLCWRSTVVAVSFPPQAGDVVLWHHRTCRAASQNYSRLIRQVRLI